jgi:hypothetical protein
MSMLKSPWGKKGSVKKGVRQWCRNACMAASDQAKLSRKAGGGRTPGESARRFWQLSL